ncbi:aminoglycoside phosphotransferase family protein [Chloroflexi bacterium TSY]|nr:aminoglycoside phosphotransferase family protein [Chloroflexi bacterium TSY]
MSESTTQWNTQVFGILPHPSTQQILLVEAENGQVQLPSIQLDSHAAWPHGPIYLRIQQGFGRLLKTEVCHLYRPHYQEDEASHTAASIHVLEMDGIPKLASSCWIGLSELEALSITPAHHEPIIHAYLTEQQTDTAPLPRPAWTRQGWRAEATAWIQATVAQLGKGEVVAVDLVRSWEISIVLRVATKSGEIFYFKSGITLPIFVNEPKIVHALHQRFPRWIPRVLALDEERQWMLTAEWGQEIGDEVELRVRQQVIGCYAQLQVAVAGQVDELLAMGCKDRRLETLPAQVEALLADQEMLSQLAVDEVERVRALLPQIQARCQQAATYAVSPSLVHGDLHVWNIALHADGQPLFFDWSDACVSHPFIDLFEHIRQDHQEMQQTLQDEYFNQWTHYESLERLRELWSIIRPLAAVHYAISWRYIVAVQEQMKGALTHYVRLVLSLLQ